MFCVYLVCVFIWGGFGELAGGCGEGLKLFFG